MPQGTTLTLTPVATPLSSAAGSHRSRHTAWDTFESLLSFVGGNPDISEHRDIKRAILSAYTEFPALHDWSYLYGTVRLTLHGAQTTGSITFDLTGGAYERLVTLTGATWPAWTELGFLRIGDVIYTIDKRIDATRLTLSATNCPSADLAALTTYTLAQDTYLLPADFIAADRPQTEQIWRSLYYVPPRDWFSMVRHDHGNTNTPVRYTFAGNPRGAGMVMRLNPSPDQDQSLDFVYRRSMRPISSWNLSMGQASIPASDTVLTLSSGVLSASMVGSTIRLGSGTAIPGGLDSPEPFAMERTILSVLSATTAQLDAAADQTFANVGYVLSDPIDLEDEAMYGAFVFGCRKHLAMARARDDAGDIAQQWQLQLALAKEADSRDMSRRSASVGDELPWPMPLKYGRRGPDVE